MTEVNIPLLRKAVEWVEEQDKLPHKGQWDQSWWVTPEHLRVGNYGKGCGTAYCLAGWVAAQAYPELAECDNAIVDGEYLATSLVAAELLGLGEDYDSATEGGLFYASNDASDIRRIAESIAGESL